jgi:hypothetical protein
MTAFVESVRDLKRRTEELAVETRHDKARFAAWVITIFLIVAGSLFLGIAMWVY